MADKNGRKRTRNYACVVYPESVSENWLELLSDYHVPCFISPLHDQDIDPTGEPKKPHYHVLLMFDSVKTQEQAREIFESFNGVGCDPVQSLRGYARYLCHLDNPDKHQYPVMDVLQLGGADYTSITQLEFDKIEVFSDILCYCRENQVTCFNRFIDYCMESHPDWFRMLLEGGCYFLKEYMKSLLWDLSNPS